MVKVQNDIATRDPIPTFLVGLAPESLADLSWTDPALGVQDCAWWPEEDASPALAEFERYGDETMTPDAQRKVVVVTRAVVLWSAEEIARAQAEQAARLQAGIVQATQHRLDAFARTRYYDDIKSASDYAGCSVQRFNIEGTYCRDARAETWEALYDMLAEVQAGTRPMPTGFADIEPELPPLVWPTP
jgi:hypothetical protein